MISDEQLKEICRLKYHASAIEAERREMATELLRQREVEAVLISGNENMVRMSAGEGYGDLAVAGAMIKSFREAVALIRVPATPTASTSPGAVTAAPGSLNNEGAV